MGQAGVDLDTSVGYLLKQAAAALRTAIEAVLRPLGMTITHYSCLELLAQRPGLSNSDLARGAFVSRQSMNVLLQALERDGLVSRPPEAPVGRVLPTELTELGRQQLATASAAVKAVEETLHAGLSPAETQELRRMLASCVQSLGKPESAASSVVRQRASARSNVAAASDGIARAATNPSGRTR